MDILLWLIIQIKKILAQQEDFKLIKYNMVKLFLKNLLVKYLIKPLEI